MHLTDTQLKALAAKAGRGGWSQDWTVIGKDVLGELLRGYGVYLDSYAKGQALRDACASLSGVGVEVQI